MHWQASSRPHNSGPRCPRGASPMRPAHAKPNVVARVASAWPDGDQDVPHKPDLAGTLGLETNRAPLPPAAVCRACIAGPCTSVPRLLFKYALQARRARLSLQPFSPSELTALPRCLVLFGLELCHTQRLLSALSPLLPHILVVCFASGTGTLILCMHARRRSEVIFAGIPTTQHSAYARSATRSA